MIINGPKAITSVRHPKMKRDAWVKYCLFTKNIQKSKNYASIFSFRYIKICKKIWNASADSLDYGRILKKFEIIPWIRITVLNYTVLKVKTQFPEKKITL